MSPLLRALAIGIMLPALPVTGASLEHLVLRQGFRHVDGTSASASLSSDGRLIAFVSTIALVPADGNSLEDIYVLDRGAQALTLETRAADGGVANGSSARPQLSADGRYLAFESVATNLTMAPDRNDAADIFVRDRLLRTTRRVSIGRNAEESNGKSDAPAISGDGRFVAFVSSATNLVADRDENEKKSDVYLVCLATEHTTRVSVDTAGRSFGAAFAPALSGDGRYVAFTAHERSPQPGHSKTSKVSAVRAVYVRDTVEAMTTCVSCQGGVTSKGRTAFAPDISSDGRITVFTMASGPDSDRTDIAVHDRSTSATRIITQHANARSAAPRVSGDGRTIVFESWASNLLCASACRPGDIDDNLLPDIYFFDGDAGRFRRVSGERGSWWSPSRAPNVDRDGRTVVFLSRQPFGPEDSTVDFDLYVCHTTCR